ncbi:MAG: hypothetical protein H7281_06850 [Bacteriovorax sp.]|nr:hypothetical protein [Bacteriovorax sp.]
MNEIISKYTNGIDTDEIILRSESAFDKLGHSFDELSDRVAKTTAELSGKTISTIKKYPLQTASAAGADSVIAGVIVNRK